MPTAVEAVRTVAGAHVEDRNADTLRALAEAGVAGSATASLVAQLNPAYPREATLRALDELWRSGLVDKHAHPLTPLLTEYALTGAGRRWARERG